MILIVNIFGKCGKWCQLQPLEYIRFTQPPYRSRTLQLVSGQLVFDVAEIPEETVFLCRESSVTTYLRTQGVIVLPLQRIIDEVLVRVTSFKHEQLRTVEAGNRIEVNYRLSEETSRVLGRTARAIPVNMRVIGVALNFGKLGRPPPARRVLNMKGDILVP